MKVAFQGEAGAYSEEAARVHFSGQILTIPYPTFEEVFRSVGEGEVACGIVPLENSIGGTIHRNYDLLLEWGLPVNGEVEHQINHCLMALPGTKVEDVKIVCSHIQAIMQCDKYVRGLDVKVEVMYDTAGSAKYIRDKQLVNTAALASRRAAELYDLEILADSVQDCAENTTRFAIIGGLPAAAPNKTLVVFTLPNEIGVLEKALHIFASQSVNLTKLESRPVPGHKWEYRFYAELEWTNADIETVLVELDNVATWKKVLGHYAAWRAK